MTDREKVIKGLECCIKQGDQGILDCDSDCPYGEHSNRLDCWLKMNHDALAMLKELYAIVRCKDCKWAEVSDNEHTWCDHVDHEFCHNNDWFCADGERKETT